ncbi:DNA primase [Escherichia phage vB_EcoS_IME347]|uniref:Putative DNA primase/helicase n=1 Tax=Escherichia phage vB_EcoS_IME347 TaxID=2496546 RepID=A0A2S1GS78_9CAUD|nr:DNA primase [Escherichia phage vB_EcoS_IME347]AWD92260.1 putative DNA primase/helicase [Escherichia phage vB_EcoS_IME347]
MNENFMQYQKEDVLPYMKGLWREILQSVCGLPNDVFNKKHQPCPNCGGKDRFRWTDKLNEPGDGGAVCNSCGNDTGIGWLMKLSGSDYSEAINIAGRFLGKVPQEYIVKANKKARRTPVAVVNAAIAEHEACAAVMERTELRPTTPLSTYEGIFLPDDKMYSVGVKSLENGGESVIHAIPCHLVHEDELDDEFCNILFINEEGEQSFYARKHTAGSVAVTGSTEKAIYLCVDWIDSQRVHLATGQEVWTCFTPANLEMVAYRYRGGRELRVACSPDDKEALYMADDRELKVIIPNPGGFRSGMERKLYQASDLI